MIHGRIYRLISDNSEKYYIGSTIYPYLSQRLARHKTCYKYYTNGRDRGYRSSYEIVKFPDAYIEVLEEGDFPSIEALRARENMYINQNRDEIVNIRGAIRAPPEVQRQRRRDRYRRRRDGD